MLGPDKSRPNPFGGEAAPGWNGRPYQNLCTSLENESDSLDSKSTNGALDKERKSEYTAKMETNYLAEPRIIEEDYSDEQDDIILRESSQEGFVDYDELNESTKKPRKLLIDCVFTHEVETYDKWRFLVKLEGRPYREHHWVGRPKSQHNILRVNRYILSLDGFRTPKTPPYYDPQYDIPDRVTGVRNNHGITEYLVLWKGLPFNQATWETQESLKADNLIQQYLAIPEPEQLENAPRPPPNSWEKLTKAATSRTGKVLRDYQLDGVNFLINCWVNNRNAILADEMGLGKTAQVASFINVLFTKYKQRGPYLIVVPLSTLEQWERELYDWTELTVLTLRGGKEERQFILDYELFYPDNQTVKYNIVLSTNQIITKTQKTLKRVHWCCLIFDEAHALKNSNSKLLQVVKTLTLDFKLLMTGTPLQNNLSELFTLLNFLQPENFNDQNEFLAKYQNISEKEEIVEIQKIIRPLMLRRMKGDVEKLAPLEEVIIECGMAPHQKQYYKAVFTKNQSYLTRGKRGRTFANLNNISMELRKVCNHPFLLGQETEDQINLERMEAMGIKEESSEFNYQSLIKSCGKMIFLDKLLQMLKSEGHRVLIFSQMTSMLDILQDYLIYRRYKFVRLDGKTRGTTRQASIDNFNEQEEIFVFLLCTKAGGVGINLTSADTVIIYDSDWNPQNDIQATARCHRIGQTKEVKVYRLLTKNSYERKMFDTASLKLGLDRALLENDFLKHDADEVEMILRRGAYHAFVDEDPDEIHEDEDIAEIINRSERRKHDFQKGSTFSVAQFQVSQEETEVVSDPKFWEKYLGEPEEEKQQEQDIERTRRRAASSVDFKEMFDDEDKEFDDDDVDDKESIQSFEWFTKDIAKKLIKHMMNFGISRPSLFLQQYDIERSVHSIIIAMRVILRWMIGASKQPHGTYIAIEKVVKDIGDYMEKIFSEQRKNDLFSYVCENATSKLNTIQIMELNHLLCSTAKNKSDVAVPALPGKMDSPDWGPNQDRSLMFAIWVRGGTKSTFSEFNLPMYVLRERHRQIIITLLDAYKEYKRFHGGSMLLVNNVNVTKALNSITARDHASIVSSMINFGLDDPEQIKEKVALSASAECLSDYVNAIIDVINSYSNPLIDNPDQSQLKEEITMFTAQKIARSIRLMRALKRWIPAHTDSEDLELMRCFLNRGLTAGIEEEVSIEKFGKNPPIRVVHRYIAKTVGENAADPVRSDSRVDGVFLEHIQSYKPEETASESEIRAPRHHVPEQSSPEIEVAPPDDGTVTLPIRSSNLVIYDLGTVVQDREGFCNERYLYNPGYVSERKMQSVSNPNERAWYRNSIKDGGAKPIFRVELKDNPSIFFEGDKPGTPWMMMVRMIEDKKREMGLPYQRSPTVTGPGLFGFTNPLVQKAFAQMAHPKRFHPKTDSDGSRRSRPHSDDTIELSSEEDGGFDFAPRRRSTGNSENSNESEAEADEKFNALFELERKREMELEKKITKRGRKKKHKKLEIEMKFGMKEKATEPESDDSELEYVIPKKPEKSFTTLKLTINFKKLINRRKEESVIRVSFPSYHKNIKSIVFQNARHFK